MVFRKRTLTGKEKIAVALAVVWLLLCIPIGRMLPTPKELMCDALADEMTERESWAESCRYVRGRLRGNLSEYDNNYCRDAIFYRCMYASP